MGIRIHSSQRDRISDCPKSMDYEHSEIHDGNYYSWSDKRTLTTGTYIEYGFQTGDKYIHVKPANFISSVDKITANFYKECSYINGTTLDYPENRNHNSSNIPTVLSVLSPAVSYAIAASQAGEGFTNQPAGDGVEFVSNDNADKGQKITIYGTVTGATDTVTSETITLDGTIGVSAIVKVWQDILGVELDRACAGTVTVREASGNAVITTLAGGVLSKGIATQTLLSAYGTIPLHDASGASTIPVGIIGKNQAGQTISSVDVLNGATEEDHGATVFWDVDKVLIGAVAGATNVWILSQRPGKRFSSFYIPGSTRGGGNQPGTSEFVLKPNTKYVIRFDNASTASNTISWGLEWYEESAG